MQYLHLLCDCEYSGGIRNASATMLFHSLPRRSIWNRLISGQLTLLCRTTRKDFRTHWCIRATTFAELTVSAAYFLSPCVVTDVTNIGALPQTQVAFSPPSESKILHAAIYLAYMENNMLSGGGLLLAVFVIHAFAAHKLTLHLCPPIILQSVPMLRTLILLDGFHFSTSS